MRRAVREESHLEVERAARGREVLSEKRAQPRETVVHGVHVDMERGRGMLRTAAAFEVRVERSEDVVSLARPLPPPRTGTGSGRMRVPATCGSVTFLDASEPPRRHRTSATSLSA